MPRPELRTCLLVIFVSVQCWSQQNLPLAHQDPKAVSIVSRALDVAGGIQAIKAIEDFTASGTITYHLGHDFQGSVSVRGAGLDLLRFDASLPGGVRTEVTSQGEVRLKTEEGSVALISSQAPLALPRFVLPYLLLAPVLGSPGYRISYKGIAQVGGKPTHDIQVQLVIPGLDDRNAGNRDRFTVDFFIDASTFLVLMMQDVVHEHRTRQILYSDYRIVRGLSVPFSIEQKGGYQPCSIRVNQISFNSGLQESDFNL